jgi:hypothetical protein
MDQRAIDALEVKREELRMEQEHLEREGTDFVPDFVDKTLLADELRSEHPELD